MTAARTAGRSLAHRAADWGLWASGAPALSRKVLTRGGRFAILLHGISSFRLQTVPPEAQPHLTSRELAQVLDWLGHRMSFLTPAEFLAGGKPGVLLTFDDGFANNFRNALPVLSSFGAPALFFVTTQHVRNPRQWLDFVRSQAEGGWKELERVPENVARDWYDGLSIEELRELSSHPLATIGSHGVTHAVLNGCTDEELTMELQESKRFLEATTGARIDLFAYPKGEYDERVVRETEKVGYTAAFTIDPASPGIRRLELPRVGIYQADRKYLSLKLSGLHRRPLPLGKP